MFNEFNAFVADETGAVTVNWVVLTAAIVTLGMTALFLVNEPIEGSAERTSMVMETYEINQDFDTQGEINGLSQGTTN